MIEKIKENTHLLLLGNLLISFFLLFYINSNERLKVIVIGGQSKEESVNNLRIKICENAINAIKTKEYSDYYIHPIVIEGLKETQDKSFDFQEIQKFYFKMQDREFCRVTGLKKNGFVAFDAVISEDGPLHYRLTSIRPIKPKISEVKEYL